MSDLWFNIRFGTYHWQWGPRGMKWKQNPAQVIQKQQTPNWKRFKIYTIFGYHL